MSDLLDAALAYGQRGWPVLPLYTWRNGGCSCGDAECVSPAKHPLRELVRNGLKNATTDLDTIEDWWTRYPHANIGLRTGDAFDVLDIDGAEGEANVVTLCEDNGGLPDGPATHTGGGGQHLLYLPAGISNRAGVVPKVDWRGRNGYIVAPPSSHASGQAYEWIDTPDTPLEEIPDWLRLILDPPRPIRPERPEGRTITYLAVAGQGTRYGIAALEAELNELAHAVEGTRNHALNAHAFNLYQLVAGGELDESFTYARLQDAAIGIGLTGREIEGTLRSARNGGLASPRYAPALPPRMQATGTQEGRPVANTETDPIPDHVYDQQLAGTVERAELGIQWAHEHAHDVDSQPPIGWLIRGIWPADAHGVLAAEQKAGKTWANLDLAVSVASGTPWMGVYPTDTQGPVVLFLGEGGKRKMLRRLRAICEHRGVRYEDLPIRVCFRVPHLTSALHLAAIADEVDNTRPALVVIDPLYLAARGAKTSQLNEMGEHLENVQHVAMRHGAALAVIHHWNKTGEGKGAKRMTGAGGAEWGRVLVSVSVMTKHTDKETGTTSVVLEWDFEGDEIPDTRLRVKRRVWSDNPNDLNSPMHYELDPVDDDPVDDEEYPNLAASARRVVHLLKAAGDWMTVSAIGDGLADQGHPLKKRTIQTALKDLNDVGLARPSGDVGTAYQWRFNDGQ